MDKYKIVEVEWEDAMALNIHILIEDVVKEELPITKSCGYLIHEDDKKIIIASMMYAKVLEQYQTIPRGMIKKINFIKEI